MEKSRSILMCYFLLFSMGCESLDAMNAKRTNMSAEAQDKMNQAATIPETNRIVHFSDSAFIGNPAAALRYVEPMPAVFSQTITINESSSLTLAEVAERITRTTAVPVRLMLEVSTAPQPASSPVSAAPGLPPVPAGIPALSLPAPTGQSAPSNYSIPGLTPMHLSYTGGLSGLLDLIASKNNVSWRYQNGAVEIYRFLTKTFKVHALPGSTELSATVERSGSGTTSGSSGSGSGGQMMGGAGTAQTTSGNTNGNSTHQTTSIDAPELSAWKDLENSIKTMVSRDGKVVISQTTGTVTITDTPQVVSQVERFIDDTNSIMTKQVVVHYRVLTVDHNDATTMGINWNAVFNAMNKSSSFNIASMAIPHAAAGSAILSALVPNTANGSMGQLSGSEILIQALETQGHVSRVTSGALTTLNNQPAPVQVVNEKAYLASVSSMQTANVGSQVSLTPGKVVTGFSMNLMPHILDDDRVLMQYSINLSTLKGIFSATSGTSTIQTPEVDTRTFMQKVSMRAGETLILSGFERAGVSLDKTGSLINGGGSAATEDKAMVVILITPVLTNG